MNPLPGHLINTYEDRKSYPNPDLPPQSIQTSFSSTKMNAQAGPSRTGPAPSSRYVPHPQPVKTEEDGWVNNHGMPWWLTAMMGAASAGQEGAPEMRPRTTPWSEERIAQLQVRLSKRLGPEYVAQRPGPGGGPKLTYIEGWKVINLANEVFGFDGWSTEIRSLHTDSLDVSDSGRCSVCVTAHIRVTLRDGTFHEDIGCGTADNMKGKGAALEKAKKEAVTDATKRALRNFGNLLGNCLYDKEYNKEVVKIKVPVPKFNVSDLHRRPEYAPPPAPPPAAVPAPVQYTPAPAAAASRQAPPPQAPVPMRPGTPLRSIYDESVNDITVATVDEHFDAEFMNDLDDMDMSVVDGLSMGVTTTNNALPPVHNPAPVPAPIYQHRHRPDAPITHAQNEKNTTVPMEQSGSLSCPSRRNSQGAAVGGADMARQASSGQGETVPSRHRGGFTYPDNANDKINDDAKAAAAARRRAAVESAAKSNITANYANGSSALVTPARPAPPLHHMHGGMAQPIRAESPRIPSGGVESAAQRATSVYRAQAAKYDLEEAGQTAAVGFSSARGIKRMADDGHSSPTKQGYGLRGQTGQRQALGEITVGGDGQKRPRGM